LKANTVSISENYPILPYINSPGTELSFEAAKLRASSQASSLKEPSG
jgi:hypothetical protein